MPLPASGARLIDQARPGAVSGMDNRLLSLGMVRLAFLIVGESGRRRRVAPALQHCQATAGSRLMRRFEACGDLLSRRAKLVPECP
jgi:hypothetical protein